MQIQLLNFNRKEDVTKKNLSTEVKIHHTNSKGTLYTGDSIEWLKNLPSSSVDLVFADPPYNINKADWDSFESQEHYIAWSMQWISESARILKNTGSLYICGFSEILADLKHPASKHFHSCRWLIWHYKNKANLRNDWGRSHESIIHLRKTKNFFFNVDPVRIPYNQHTMKYPSHPQADTSQYGKGSKRDNWMPHPAGAKPKDVIEIPTLSNGMQEKTAHPTQKPEELLRKIILATTPEDGLVLDPFSGSGTTLVVAEQLKRRWLGCDLSEEYNSFATDRLKTLKSKTVEEWLKFDRENLERRLTNR